MRTDARAVNVYGSAFLISVKLSIRLPLALYNQRTRCLSPMPQVLNVISKLLKRSTRAPESRIEPDDTMKPLAPVDALQAILQSRARWRRQLFATVDLIFTTDDAGLLTSLSEKKWLGVPSASLMGRNMGALWGETALFQPKDAQSRVLISIRDKGGSAQDMILLTTPLSATPDGVSGYSGSLTAVPTRPAAQIVPDTVSLSLVRQLPLEPVISTIRSAVLPRLAFHHVEASLESLLGCTIFLLLNGHPSQVAPDHSNGSRCLPDEIHSAITPILDQPPHTVTCARFMEGTSHGLVVQDRIRSEGAIALAAWRSQPWNREEEDFLLAACQILASHLELDGVYRRVLEAAPFDINTGLLNWQGFRGDILRRIPRLDQQQMAATLLLVRVEGLGDIMTSHGFKAGEEASRQTVDLLCKAVRPSDPAACLGRDLFAFWMDGGDRFAAAERAERITAHGVPVLLSPPLHLAVQIGLVSREPGMDETLEALLERATTALNEAPSGSGSWRFSYEAP